MLDQLMGMALVIMILGYGTAFMIGGPRLANRVFMTGLRVGLRLTGRALIAIGRGIHSLGGRGGPTNRITP